ncbi:MAG: LruC domain-containing protein [Candidatus Methylacidiphilales bacterium]
MKNNNFTSITKILKVSVAFLLFFTILTAEVLKGQTIFVNDNNRTGDIFTTAVGNDAGTGSAASPYLTITKALAMASAGNTIKVDAGVYIAAFTINKNVTLQGTNFGVKGTSTRVTESQIKDSKVTISGSNIVVFDGFHIYQTTTATGGTIDVGNTPTTVKNCIIERVGATTGVIAVGLQTVASTSAIRIERNLFTGSTAGSLFSGHKTWNSGMYSNGGSNITIDNNTFQNCRTGLNQDNMSSGTTISNNVFGTNGTSIAFGGTTATSGSYTLNGNTFTVTSGLNTVNLSNVTTSFRLDITNSTIGSTAAASMTIDQCLALESSILHKATTAGKNGLVTFVSGKLFKTSTTTFANNILYATSGNIIHCASGTVSEAFTINKSVKLYGNNYTVNPNDGSWNLNAARAAESVISGGGVTIAASDVELKGFKFSSTTSASTAIGNTNPAATYSNIIINNNIISGSTNIRPIWFTASSGQPFDGIQVTNNRIESITISPVNNLLTGIDLWRSSNHTVSGNYISGMSYNGIKSDGFGTHSITGNRMANCKVAGISIQSTYGNGQIVTASNNTISGCQQGVAIWSSTNTFSNIKFQVTNNTITVDAGKLDINYPAINIANISSGDISYTNLIRGNSVTLSGTIGSAPYGVIPGPTAFATYGISILGDIGKLDIQNNLIDGGNVAGVNVPTASLDMAGIMVNTNFPIQYTSGAINTPLAGTIRVLNNDIRNFKNGLASYNYVSSTLDAIPTGVSLSVNENSIVPTTGKSFLIGTGGAGIAGTCNWYGSAVYSTAANTISGNVNMTPFLVNGTDNDANALGFQPRPGVCTGVNVLAPTVGASSCVFTTIAQTTMSLTFTKGNGSKRLVIVKSGSAINVDPTDNSIYSANSVFSNGTALGGGYVVLNDTSSSLTVTGLTANTEYYFTTIEYNYADAVIKYASNLKNTCAAFTLQIDTDNDGVPDVDDQFPTDQYRAFTNRYPAANNGTLMFEDLWPSRGDYDFNDLVVDYRFNTIVNANNNVVEVEYTFITRAIGGSLHNGFIFQLDGINSNKITSVTGSKATGAEWITLNSNGTEAGNTTNANILVFDDAYKILNTQPGFSYVNTDPLAPASAFDTTRIIVKFLVDGVAPSGGTLSANNFPTSVFNPYIIVNKDRGKEIHLIDRLPSAKMNVTYFGQMDDASNVNTGKYFKTKNNLPWALNIGTSIPHTKEKIDITAAYLKFIDWAISNGTSNATWYLNSTENRDNTKLIIR